MEESYVENVDELIVQAVTEASQKVQNDSAIQTANKNKEIVSILYQRGIFNLKDAVVKVAGSWVSPRTQFICMYAISITAEKGWNRFGSSLFYNQGFLWRIAPSGPS